jgi:hypothetical protein
VSPKTKRLTDAGWSNRLRAALAKPVAGRRDDLRACSAITLRDLSYSFTLRFRRRHVVARARFGHAQDRLCE